MKKHLRRARYEQCVLPGGIGDQSTATMTTRLPFVLTQALQLRVKGQPSTGLADSLGRLLDGDRDGTPGGDIVRAWSR